MMMKPLFKPYHLVNGRPEIFSGVDVIKFCVRDTRLEVLFKPGFVFGRQWLEMSDIEKPFVFEHCEKVFKIYFAPEGMSEEDIRVKLVGNFLL